MHQPQSRSAFIGRTYELEALRGDLEDILAGHGRLCLISGEPGIGKTRISEELSAHARDRGIRVIWGRCWEGHGAPPFWPWVQVIRSCVGDDNSHRLEILLNSEVPEIANLLPEVVHLGRPSTTVTKLQAVPSPNNPEEARFRLFDSAARLLRTMAKADPLVVVIDDLQEADQSSLLMLRFVARALKESRVMLVGNYRDREVRSSPALNRLIGEIAREGEELALRGLSEIEISQFLRKRAGLQPDAGFLAAISRATAGNPLFLDGIVRMLISENKVSCIVSGGGDLAIPHGMREAIRARLNVYSESTRSALSIAAVIGQEFDVDCLQRACETSTESLLEALDEVERDGVLSKVSGPRQRYRFYHDLLRETLYDDLPSFRRLQLHLGVAQILERLYADNPEPHFNEIAYHFRRALPLGDIAAAIDYSIKAGEVAQRMLGYEDALLQWETALELMERQRDNEERRAHLLIQLGLMGNVDYGRAAGYFEQALRLLERLDKHEELALTHAKLGDVYAAPGKRIDIRRAAEHYRKAASVLTEVQGSSAVELSIRIDTGLANLATRTLGTNEGLATSSRAIQTAERHGDARLFCTAARLSGLLLFFAGKLSEAFGVLDRAWERADELNDSGNSYSVAWTGGSCRGFLYDFAQAQAWYERELSRARLVHASFPRRLLSGLLGRVRLEQGDIAAARPLLSQTPTEYLERDLGLIAFWDGRWEEAEQAWTQIREKTHLRGAREEASDLLPWLATVRRLLNLNTEREALLLDALSLCTDNPLEYVEMRVRPELALLYAETGRQMDAVPHLTRCREIAGHAEDWRGIAARIARSEAVVAAAQGNFQEAEAYFQSAVRILQRYPSPFHEAETLHCWGRALFSANESAKAIEKLNAAIEIYRRHGVGNRWIERVEADFPRPRGAALASPKAPLQAENIFHKEGDYWTVAFGGTLCRLKHTKGLLYIAHLLQNPGTQLSTIELIHFGETTGEQPTAMEGIERGESSIEVRPDLGDAGGILDHQAKINYRRRLRELRQELAEAECFNDLGKKEQLRAEIDFLTSELTAGMGRRSRKAASHRERARLAVYKRIRSSLDEIRKANSALGKHLTKTLRTGYQCAYLPDRRIDWNF